MGGHVFSAEREERQMKKKRKKLCVKVRMEWKMGLKNCQCEMHPADYGDDQWDRSDGMEYVKKKKKKLMMMMSNLELHTLDQ